MYNIKILENAYTAVIELANSCTAKKLSTCRDVYHILKFVRLLPVISPNNQLRLVKYPTPSMRTPKDLRKWQAVRLPNISL